MSSEGEAVLIIGGTDSVRSCSLSPTSTPAGSPNIRMELMEQTMNVPATWASWKGRQHQGEECEKGKPGLG